MNYEIKERLPIEALREKLASFSALHGFRYYVHTNQALYWAGGATVININGTAYFGMEYHPVNEMTGEVYETIRHTRPLYEFLDGRFHLLVDSPVPSMRNTGPTKEDLRSLEDMKSNMMTNNQKRAVIIKKAKRFVEENLSKDHPQATSEGIWFEDGVTVATDEAEFIVDEKKRAVTVLIKGIHSNLLFSKGIAKCHPHDVFNEHIGKAIALGRALGLDVSEFEQAVQPDEFAEGQVVIYHSRWSGKNVRTIARIENKHAWTEEGGFFHDYRVKEPNFKITNDSRAQYGEVD